MNKEVRNWLIKAFEDYRVVRHEMNLPEDEMVTSSVCFHCQQFVEKLLKAYLISKGIEFERTHNLEFLKELCKKQDKDFDILDFGNLTMYAVETRYPERFLIPSVEEARRSFEIAQNVKEFVLEKLGIKEDEIR